MVAQRRGRNPAGHGGKPEPCAQKSDWLSGLAAFGPDTNPKGRAKIRFNARFNVLVPAAAKIRAKKDACHDLGHDGANAPPTRTRPPNRIAWEAYFAWAKASATGIVTISQAAKAEIVGHLGVAPDRVFVVPLAARANVAQVSDSPERNALLQSVGLPHDAAFVLYGGTLEPRKNLPRLIAAFADVVREMPQDDPLHLVLAGGTWAGHSETLQQIARDAGIADARFVPPAMSAEP